MLVNVVAFGKISESDLTKRAENLDLTHSILTVIQIKKQR